jgi:hypothetical protein
VSRESLSNPVHLKYLISTSDDYLSTEDVVLGYKQLHEIERVNRDLKHTVDVRPVYHRREDRIRSHVQLCWLALLLIRLIETKCGQSWHQVLKVMRPLSVAIQASEYGTVKQTNRVSSAQKSVLDALGVKAPKRFLELPTPQSPLKCRYNKVWGARERLRVLHVSIDPILVPTNCRTRV